MKLENLVQRNSQVFPDKPWVTFEGKTITFKEFKEQTNSVANSLIKLGLRKGDRVAVLLENCDEVINLYFSIPKIGAICVPMNYLSSKNELIHILDDCQPKIFILNPNYMKIAELAKEKIKTIQHYILVTDNEIPEGFLDFEKLYLDSKEEPIIDEQYAYDMYEDVEPAFIQYTGGTTGLPKGVLLNHKSMIENAMMTALSLREKASSNEKGLLVLPVFHAAAILGILLTFMGGTTIIIHNGFILKKIYETIEQEKITGIGVVPTMLNMIIKDPDVKKYDLSSISKIAYGGAPISPALLKETLKLFPNVAFSQVFGQTEAGPGLTMLTQDDHKKIIEENQEKLLLSAGRPAIGIRIKVVDPITGEEMPSGEAGEIIAKTSTKMLEYWNNLEKTESTVRNGWLYTGDIGHINDEGYLFLVDRKKDMIVSGGENIYSKEVEDALYQHPDVRECAVIGIPHEKWGEAVHAVVVLNKDFKKSPELEEDLINFCKDHIARYKAPKSIDFKRGLPKSAQGKVLKRKIREKYWKDEKRAI
ncbi:MAG: long-chain-fatty-acid--CoA ligase [Candidatus Helarchaeota archaeon]|nr:long-chain-fatty-acid--CoA ligase [Candidatus Helarchaeota archaeon]